MKTRKISTVLLLILGLTIIQTARPVGLLAGVSYLLGAGSLGSYLYRSWHPTAKDFADRAERISCYQITVKVKRHVKTVTEQSFSSSDYRKVIAQSLAYAQTQQTPKLKIVFKPGIMLKVDWTVHPLKNIITSSLPSEPEKIVEHWKATKQALVDCLYVPSAFPAAFSAPQSIGDYLMFFFIAVAGCVVVGLIILSFAPYRRKKAR